jgi:hypothetical protein
MRRVEEMTVNTNGDRPTTTPLKALTDVFQTGDGKRPMTVWRDEIKALKESMTPEEYAAFAELAAQSLGKTTVV